MGAKSKQYQQFKLLGLKQYQLEFLNNFDYSVKYWNHFIIDIKMLLLFNQRDPTDLPPKETYIVQFKKRYPTVNNSILLEYYNMFISDLYNAIYLLSFQQTLNWIEDEIINLTIEFNT